MLNAEGKRGEQYAEWFESKYGTRYMNCNISAPYSPERYTEALEAMAAMKPTVGIDSASHMHDGPGGLLEYHDAELDRIAGKTDWKKRDKCNFTAWIRPKAAENKFIYTMIDMECPIILCFRAKEKIKIVAGKEPVDLGWQPIAGDRITFETIFTLVLPPHSKGVPDLQQSELRMPFDQMIPAGKPIDESLGVQLAEWARGSSATSGEPSLLDRIKAARSIEDLDELAALAKQAPDAQKKKLREAYGARLAELKAATEPAEEFEETPQ